MTRSIYRRQAPFQRRKFWSDSDGNHRSTSPSCNAAVSSTAAAPAPPPLPLLLSLLLLLTLLLTLPHACAANVLMPRATTGLRPLPLMLALPLFSATATPLETGGIRTSTRATDGSDYSRRSAAALAAPMGEAAGDSVVAAGDGGARQRGEGGSASVAIRGSGVAAVPKVPFCRAGADVATIWMPVWNTDSQRVEATKRVVVFGGKGVNYLKTRTYDQLSYLSDMWSLHITNTGFQWEEVTPSGNVSPSPRWQTGDAVAYGSSLVVYGGDDQTTNQVGGLGDLWAFSPETGAGLGLRGGSERRRDDEGNLDDWTSYTRGGKHPGERREPSLTMINSTLLLQGGKVLDGETNEVCDSRFFLLDMGDPEGLWREGPSFPGKCGVGQTMNTVNLTRHDIDREEGSQSQVRAVVFGGCKWDSEGLFSCSNDLYAYDMKEDSWEEIIPESDADAHACKTEDTDMVEASAAPEGSSSSAPPVSSSPSGSRNDPTEGDKGHLKDKDVVCPGLSTVRPLGRHAHASAYIESKEDDINALFIFGGRENNDDLVPLGDLWMFDFNKMRWSEIIPESKEAPSNRFDHSLTVWQGGVGDGVASLVVFGGQTITKTGQSAYLNDVWLYTPHTGAWREVSHSDCKEGASGIARGGNWTAVCALVTLLLLVVVVQCCLHRMCPQYQPPRRRRRQRRKTEDAGSSGGTSRSRKNGGGAATAKAGLGGANGAEEGTVKRGKSEPSLQTQALLPSSSSSGSHKPSYQALE